MIRLNLTISQFYIFTFTFVSYDSTKLDRFLTVYFKSIFTNVFFDQARPFLNIIFSTELKTNGLYTRTHVPPRRSRFVPCPPNRRQLYWRNCMTKGSTEARQLRSEGKVEKLSPNRDRLPFPDTLIFYNWFPFMKTEKNNRQNN